MSVQRELQAGPLIAAAGALLLLVALFLDWFGEFSAWTIFEVLDLVLAALASAAIAVGLQAFGVPERVPASALPPIGVAAFVVVVSQLLNHPPAGTDRDLEMGAWLGLVGSLGMLVGGLLSVARISLAVNVSDRGEGPGSAPPADAVPPPAPAPAPDDPPPPAPPGPDDKTQRLGE